MRTYFGNRDRAELIDDALASGAAGRMWLAVSPAELELVLTCPCPATGGTHWHISPSTDEAPFTLAIEVEPYEQLV